jgi:hypothetical protein
MKTTTLTPALSPEERLAISVTSSNSTVRLTDSAAQLLNRRRLFLLLLGEKAGMRAVVSSN